MDSSFAASPVRNDNDIELGPVTHWPTVYAAIGVAGAVVLGLAAVAVLAALQPAPPPETPEAVAAVVPAPLPRPRAMVVKTADPVAPPTVAEAVPPPEQAPADVSPPSPPPVPIPVATAVTPLIRVSDSAPAPEPPPPMPAPPPEFALFDDLQAHAHEIALDVDGKLAEALRDDRKDDEAARQVSAALKTGSPELACIRAIMVLRPDLEGLPLRCAKECKRPAEEAKGVQEISRAMRREQGALPPNASATRYDRSFAQDPTYYSDFGELADRPARSQAIVSLLSEHKDWLKEENASTLAQMLQPEDVPVRLALAKALASIKGRSAGKALARLALFDMTAEVREAAAVALRGRPAEEYRPTLLDGFRHPWPAVADHAAAALEALDDRGAAADLEKMLHLPDPSAPALNEQKKWVKAELVKVNHLRNCLLCHPSSSTAEDLVRAPIPVRDRPLPAVYYDRIRGEAVHADVTYFRQDFSLMEAVKDHGPWPLGQRFDYLVRRRPLTDQELIDMADSAGKSARSYPQRAAVLSALEKLTRPDNARPIDKVGLGP